MEIEEIKENEAVDAILQIGFPGGYGFYGVADILCRRSQSFWTFKRYLCSG